MTYQGIRREPIFDVQPGLGARAPSAAPASHDRRSLRPAAWLALATSAVLLAGPAVLRGLAPADPEATGSIAMVPVAERADTRSAFALALAQGDDPASLRRRWLTIAELVDVAGLEPALVPSAAPDRPSWMLAAGRWTNAAAAAERCGALRAAGIGCEVVRRDGAALTAQGPRPDH